MLRLYEKFDRLLGIERVHVKWLLPFIFCERDINMRHAVLFLALMTGVAHAATKETVEKCTTISKLAEAVMTKRQEGIAMSDLMKAANDGTAGGDFVTKMITAAYQVNRYNTQQVQQREIADFRDQYFLACIQKFKD